MSGTPDPDWLYHHFEARGPAAELAAFRQAAAGAGLIPWQLDLPALEEDWLHLMLAPGPHERGISLEGARILAGQLREAVARQQARAEALALTGTACPLDLNALFPVPREILALGPADPQARDWLWREWGTPCALRHVAAAPGKSADTATHGVMRLRFWSADWTPWRALQRMRDRFPTISFSLQPVYDEGA
ncbi:hypothetical protein ACFOD4_21915 [Pseudoroseomonas globiformis]|uniref:Uncharacterized protein n=1 Tax=Teichococcus globiformis TaxID=2307229 RepID=A0ABV7G8C6_9PROT